MDESDADRARLWERRKGRASERQGSVKLKRAERSAAIRRELVRAAVAVIGAHGYEGASISRITEKAGVAQGTFYLYFDSRQAIFDVVLPELTAEMLREVADNVKGAVDFLDAEERGISSFFSIVRQHPGLFRIINEAQVAAPEAFQRHLDELIRRYKSSLARAHADGQIAGLDPADFDEIAYMLIGARNYLYLAYASKKDRPLDYFVRAYMRFVASALNTSETFVGA